MPAQNFTKYPKIQPWELLPYSSSFLEKKVWKNFLSKNGYFALSKKLMLKVFSEIEEIENLWQAFSPENSVFDLWSVRNAFFRAYNFPPYFLVLFKENNAKIEILGVLPLWHNTDKVIKKEDEQKDNSKYVWFGSNWPEDNVFYVQDTELIPLLLAAAPKPLELACIVPKPEYEFLKEFFGFTLEEEKKYFLDLTQFRTIDDFFAKLKKKKRYNLRRDRKRIKSLSPKIIYNRKEDLEELFNLSIKRFREIFPEEIHEHSAFEDERRKNVFRNLLNSPDKYQTRIITTVIGGKIEAVEFGLVYKKTYYALNAGADISHYSGLGVFSNLLVIEDALNLGCEKIDFLEGDNNWKESWQLSCYYQYQFKK